MKRSELYEAVWAEPMTRLATRFGLSDTALKNVCRKRDVPMPPRGHWAKVAAGKPVQRTALVEAAEDVEISFRATNAVSSAQGSTACGHDMSTFVSVPNTASAPGAIIRIEIRRGSTTIIASWPIAAAGECSAWTRALLQ